MAYRKWKCCEFETTTAREYENPFWDVRVRAEFRQEDGSGSHTANAFYDGMSDEGRHRWKVRWTPNREGVWNCRIYAEPANDELSLEFRFAAEDPEPGSRGFLRADKAASYGFRFDNGEPFFLFGDTMYNLFGAAYNGVDIERILRARQSQGINYVRARLQVSSFYEIHNQWQTKDCWPWGGNAQLPDFAKLNLDYFRTVDRVVALASELRIGLEMILQAWLMEHPFNDRGKFIPEYEAFWHEYAVARYAAFDSVYIWCPANEYEYYPRGIPVTYNKESNRWLARVAGQIRSLDPHAHPIGAHNWYQKLSLFERVGQYETIDVYLVQTNWVDPILAGESHPSLCAGIEHDLRHHSGGRRKVTVCAEFGYERTEGLPTVPVTEFMNPHHTRRGQWRAGFSGYPVVHGFDNTWGLHMRVDHESEGTKYLLPYYRFMTETLRFERLSPSPESLVSASGSEEAGTLPLCLADRTTGATAVYFPTPGRCELRADATDNATFRWMNPRTGRMGEAERCEGNAFVTPQGSEDIGDEPGDDWVLLLERAEDL